MFQRDYLKRCLYGNTPTKWWNPVLQEDRLDSVVLLFHFLFLKSFLANIYMVYIYVYYPGLQK